MTLYIGIDLSTDPANTGIAALRGNGENGPVVHLVHGRWCGTVPEWLAQFQNNFEEIPESDFASKARRIVTIVNSIVGSPQRENGNVIVAIDVPFGWPTRFRNAIFQHEIGNAIMVDYNNFCYRYTEQIIIDDVNYRSRSPLSVSTDKIGRTAMLGSWLLASLTSEGFAIQRNTITGEKLKIIEVYPTATAYALAAQDPNGKFTLRKFYNRFLEANRLNKKEPIDRFDALFAAYTAYLVNNQNHYFDWNHGQLNNEQQGIVDSEGWIWAPNRAQIDGNDRRVHLDFIRPLLQRARREQFPRS